MKKIEQEMRSLPVPRSYTINVTQEHIDKAEQNNSAKCMWALAMRDAISDIWSIHITASTCRFNLGGEPRRDDDGQGYRYSYRTPGKVSHYIEQFDLDRTSVKPFKAKLHADQCDVGIVKKRGKRLTPKSKHRKRTACEFRGGCNRRFAGVSVVKKKESK